MKMIIEIMTSQEEFKRCLMAAWKGRYEEDLDLNAIKDFNIKDEVLQSDIENLLMGSLLGQLMNKNTIIMKRIG